MAEFPALLVSADLIQRGSNLNGRRWAGQSLVQAWAAHRGPNRLDLAGADPTLLNSLTPLVREAGHSGPLQMHGLVDPQPFASIGGLFIPDPSIGRWARWRQAIGSEQFSLIGQIHTLNTPAAIAHLEALASEPVHPWDALICTSQAGRAVVEAVFDDRESQLQQRFGIQARLPRPQLPVIPLPVPVEAMQQALPSQAEGRQALGLPAEAHVCLWLGRLSLLTKLDPWPTYQLLQRLAGELTQPLCLIECGPDDTPEQGRHCAELRQLCPAVRFLRLGGSEPVSEAVKFQALAAADVTLSLVDNCQETFGLSVIEAMASGLPVLASDWDGYRDSIRHGIDGFLVPSRWAPGSDACSVSLGWQQQLELLSFPATAGALGQLVQLDMSSAHAALATLLGNPALARAMGEQGRASALQRFSGRTVMQQYTDLFAELGERRSRSEASANGPSAPLALDPVKLFAGFASTPATAPWPTTDEGSSSPPPLLLNNRQALWHPLLASLTPNQRQELQQELHRKHL